MENRLTGIQLDPRLTAWEDAQRGNWQDCVDQELAEMEKAEREAWGDRAESSDFETHWENVRTDYLTKAEEAFADWLEDHRGDAEGEIERGHGGPLYPWN